MFFYRPWVGNEGQYGTSSVSQPDLFATQFAYHRWGYAALLLITLLAGVILNGLVVGSFLFDWKNLKKMPHTVVFTLCIRDLLVALILIPICVDWYVVHVGAFSSGEIMCKITSFFDYALAAQYALILVIFAVILYTRKFPKFEDTLDPIEDLMVTQMQRPPSHMSNSSHNRPPSHMSNSYNQPRRTPSRQSSQNGSRAPSVVGSVDGYRKPVGPGQPGFRPQRPNLMTPPKRPGSVTGSIEGRLANSGPAGRMGRQFMASSPIQEATDEDLDLWDAASLDYPGRQSPRAGDFEEFEHEDQIMFFDEPKYHSWHHYILHFSWFLAIGLGVPAAMFTIHKLESQQGPSYVNNPGYNSYGSGLPSRPGCYIDAKPFINPHSAVINDPGFNFILSFIIICYLITFVVLLLLFALMCYKGTKSPKWKRHFKILIMCTLVFLISRSPMDIVQFKELIHAARGFKNLSVRAFELEWEIMLIWCTYLPIVLHPIITMAFVSEYRLGALKTLRTICGCQQKYEQKQQDKMDHYKSDEILSERSAVSKTQVSNML